jgi:heat shock protein HtpX
MMANQLKTTVLLAALTVLIIFFGRALGWSQGMVIAFLFAMVMNLGSYWFSDKIVLAMYRAQELTQTEAPEIHRIVAELAQQAQIPKPRIYMLPSESPNAFATGRNPEHAVVAVTQGIVRLLKPEELRGVLAHELGHVRNRDILIGSIAATLAGAIMLIADIARFGAIFGGFGRSDDEGGGGNIISLIVMSIVGPLAAVLIQMAISRSREYIADETGARLCGNPLSLARALEKLHHGAQKIPMQNAKPATENMFIVSPFTGGGLLSLFSTHPPIEERIRRLQAMAVGS